jgi:phosphoribosyl 1,2-cyclic phosphate phosphodiesterase
MRVTILGCGHSAGVPIIGCECVVCRSPNPRNIRGRVSVHIEINGLSIIIDTSPDFRQQILRENINKVDGVLYTHDHADHTHGIDDLRSFNYKRDAGLPIYGNAAALNSIQSRFGYAFAGKPSIGLWIRPSLLPHMLPDEPVVRFEIQGVEVVAFQQQHGKIVSMGYRIGDFAYSTDTNHLPDSAFEALAGVKVWVVDCLRYTPSFSHSHLEQTLEWVRRVQPEQAILTHMAHELDYDTLLAELPSGVVPAFDGMKIEL